MGTVCSKFRSIGKVQETSRSVRSMNLKGSDFILAHGTFVCGKNGGGVAEQYNCESDVDICVGTLSKAAGCHGGFIACSKRWKQLIQSGVGLLYFQLLRQYQLRLLPVLLLLWQERKHGLEGKFGIGCRTFVLSLESP